ncbi:MAG: hypothetical protein K9M02_03935 [Thiohalocapsa sp.]|nr:hypothetical protein [Thiohalocapsa sp.]
MLLALVAGSACGAGAATDRVPEACAPFEQGIFGETATMACFGALDTDGDAALSADEARALPRLQGHFEAMDADGNGLLSPDEFQGLRHTPAQRGGGKGV